MPKILFANNAESTLDGSLTNVATAMNVAAGTGAEFPAPGAGESFNLTLTKLVSNLPVHEIVKVTARSGDAMTIVRGQEGTTPTTFSAGDIVSARLTAGAANSFAQKDDAVTFSQPVSVPTPTAPGHAVNKAYVDGAGISTAVIHAALLSF